MAEHSVNLIDVIEGDPIPGSGGVKRSRIKSHWSHAYYVKVGLTDVDKMRDEAAKAAAGDQYDTEGVCSIIHYHRLLLDEETVKCDGHKHDVFHREGCKHASKG